MERVEGVLATRDPGAAEVTSLALDSLVRVPLEENPFADFNYQGYFSETLTIPAAGHLIWSRRLCPRLRSVQAWGSGFTAQQGETTSSIQKDPENYRGSPATTLLWPLLEAVLSLNNSDFPRWEWPHPHCLAGCRASPESRGSKAVLGQPAGQ